MRSQAATRSTIPLLGLLLAGKMPVMDAVRDRMTVEEDDISFKIDQYDDGRSKSYAVIYDEDGVRSKYKFNVAGFVTNIKAGSEKYKVSYKSNGDLKSVTLRSSRRRDLITNEGDEDDDGESDLDKGTHAMGGGTSHRRQYTCDDCEEVWDTVCDEGVLSVCELVDYGAPIMATGEASIKTLCETLGAACSGSEGTEVCAGQCDEDDDDGDDDGRVINPCLDSASAEYACAFDPAKENPLYLDLNVCDLYDADAADIPACFEDFGKSNIETLSMSFQDHLTTLPAGIFDGLSAVSSFDFSYTAVESLPVGIFSGLIGLVDLSMHYTLVTALPLGIFDDIPNLEKMVISSTPLTSLPAGLFLPLKSLQYLDLRNVQWDYAELQCLPSSTATEILVVPENLGEGTCECQPAEAIVCQTGSCMPGMEGYTCE